MEGAMTLDEAIAELHRVTPANDPWTGEDFVHDPDNIDDAIAAILNAVIAGELRKATEVRALVQALRHLANDVAGNVTAFEDEMRQAIGNTNYNVLLHQLEKGAAALTAWENRNG